MDGVITPGITDEGITAAFLTSDAIRVIKYNHKTNSSESYSAETNLPQRDSQSPSGIGHVRGNLFFVYWRTGTPEKPTGWGTSLYEIE